MKLRPRRQTPGSPVRKVKLQLPLKKPKENAAARLNRRSIKSGGLMEKNNIGHESNPNQDPGPSNRRQMSSSPVSNWNCSKLDLECFVAVKRLTVAETEEMKQNLAKGRHNGRNRSQTEKKAKLSLPGPTVMTQSATPQVSPSPLSQMEIAPGCGIMQLPEEVFHHILGFVTFADVKAARFVNKRCRQVATTPLRRSSKEIRLDHQVFDCFTEIDDGQFPVYRFEVQLYDDPEKIKVCYPYFSGICAWVKELTLKMNMDLNTYEKSNIQMDADTFPTNCIYQDLTHLNLRLFERTPNSRNPEFWQGFTDFVQSILRNSPNLREVNVEYSIRKGVKLSICRVIEDLFPNANSIGTSKLSCIDFQEVPLEKIELAKWSTLNLKLRKLAINLPRCSDLMDLLAVFLEIHSGTLKELTLNLNRCDYKTRKTVTFTFPKMETLEQLGFTGRGYGAMVIFPGIDYVRLFPSLKKLDLRNSGIEWEDFLGNDLIEPTNTVQELIFPWTGLDPTPVVSASSLFPCVRKLEIEPNSVVLNAVCDNMPNLEVLSLIVHDYYSFDNYDYLITGMRSEVCRMFQGVMTETWMKKLKAAEGQSLARLQDLKTLKLSNPGFNLICFSRLSFHVFQQMSSLKCLDLNGRADRQRRYYNDETEWQFLADLREKFVVL